MKTVFIIPGFEERTDMAGYKEAMKIFRSKGIRPIPVKIDWKRKVMSDYVRQFLEQYKKHLSRAARGEIFVFGFSYGSMIALISAPIIHPKKLYLCSLSPFFKEDFPGMKKSWVQKTGAKRVRDFKKISFDQIAKHIAAKTILIAGDKEGKEVERRAQNALKKIKNSKLFIAKGAKHNLGQKEYIKILKKVL